MLDYISLIEEQLQSWPLARDNYSGLGSTQRRAVALGDLTVGVQLNPARIVSTAASVDSKGNVGKRPCFLCEANRPAEQAAWPILEGWKLLVNPYPVFPVHFTIVADSHVPQSAPPLEMAAMADAVPGLTFFFNGARAGASAPDHLHCQAVLTDELPLMLLTEKMHPLTQPGIIKSSALRLSLPFGFVSAVISPDREGMRNLNIMSALAGVDRETGEPDKGLLNVYFWRRADGWLRIVAVPRAAHRPSCYYAEGCRRIMVSPGALEMAGIVITPRQEDYARISADDLTRIYSEVAWADNVTSNTVPA